MEQYTPVAEPGPGPKPQGIIGVPCFGNLELGCGLTEYKREVMVEERTPIAEPEPEPQGIVETSCFGNPCALTEDRRAKLALMDDWELHGGVT